MEYVVFDTETTGLNAESDVVIELSAVKLNGNLQPIGEFDSLLYRDVRITKEIVSITGITPEMLVDEGRPAEEVITEFRQFIRTADGQGTCALVAHNAEFDLLFIQEEFKRFGQEALPASLVFWDTLAMSRIFCRWMRDHKLDSMCDVFGIELSQHHRSMFDTRATAQLFQYLYRMAEARGYPCHNTLTHRKDRSQLSYAKKHLYVPGDLPLVFGVPDAL